MWCVYDVLTFFREKEWLKGHQSIAEICTGVGVVAEKKHREIGKTRDTVVGTLFSCYALAFLEEH